MNLPYLALGRLCLGRDLSDWPLGRLGVGGLGLGMKGLGFRRFRACKAGNRDLVQERVCRVEDR